VENRKAHDEAMQIYFELLNLAWIPAMQDFEYLKSQKHLWDGFG
jgi:hypothetical protein